MFDFSNAEISVEGEYGECLVCGESFHWTQLTNLASGSYCDVHVEDVRRVEALASDLLLYGNSWERVNRDGTRERIDPRRVRFSDDEADMGHDTALERDTFGDAVKGG